MGNVYGYIRVSSQDQNEDRQLSCTDLLLLGDKPCPKFFDLLIQLILVFRFAFFEITEHESSSFIYRLCSQTMTRLRPAFLPR